MKYSPLLLGWILTLGLCPSGHAKAETANGTTLITNVPHRDALSLDGKWHYIPDPYLNGFYNYRREPHNDETANPGAQAYFANQKPRSKSHRIEYDFDQSPTLLIPGAWGVQVPELTWYEGGLWMKRSFEVEKAADKRYFLYFGAVNYEAQVWLNGRKLGTHLGGFTPFNLEATELLEDGENFVVVLANNARRPEGIPTVSTDWWNHGGITRSVQLLELPSTFIQDYTLQLSQDGQRLEGAIRLNGKSLAQDVMISIPEAQFSWHGTTDSQGRASFSIDAPHLERWSPQSPKLYDVAIEVDSDKMKDQVGFRTIEVKGTEILLNGKKLFLRGISVHEENPLHGTRLHSPQEARMMLSWVQELNGNFARLAHYPHNEHMVREADRLGILLWKEVPVYWTIDWDNEDTLDNAKNQLTEMIVRDRNRASVIIWSVANETPVGEARNAFLGELLQTARSLDHSRLVSAAMEVDYSAGYPSINDPFGAYTDIVSFNQYFGWYSGDADDFSDLNWVVEYDKPVIVSEWGGGALYGHRGDKETIWTEDFQAHLYRETIAGLFNIPHLAGTTPWILADFRSPRRALSNIQDMWNRKGIIAEGGHKKLAFHVLQEFYESDATQSEQ
ncbi:MAG: glycoside hydrolase family 2 protein [Opitutales bacterium]